MSHAGKRSSNKMLEFAMPKEGIGPQLVKWVRGVVRSNNQLVPALERLRSSYKALLVGKSVTDSEEILWQVEGALKDAERATNVLTLDSLRRPEGPSFVWAVPAKDDK
jgi:hypothetical protein